jgi:hypothetical protein
MSMSFFQWLREGVRQAVVLGLADAVEDVGTRQSTEDFGPALAQSLRERLAVPKDAARKPQVVEHPAPGRRRLGRSLESLTSPAAKVA